MILFHPHTKTAVDHFLANPGSTIGLVGERGAGKYYLGQYIAENLLGTNIQNHPYFLHIDASEKGSGIDSVRVIQKKLTLQVPGQNKVRRVVVLEQFDNFGAEAQNALLKTLEEPPADTVLILTISSKENVLPTIYSRVPTITVNTVPFTVVKESFEGRYSLADIQKSYQLSSGAAGLLVSLLDGDESHELLQAIARAKSILGQKKYQRIAEVDAIHKDKNLSTLVFLDGLIRIFDASFVAARKAGKPVRELKTHQKRLELTHGAIADIQGGVGGKLVLTRLFLAL